MASEPSGSPSEKKEDEKVAFYKLFSFADRRDIVLMIVGTISAIGNGVSQPLMTLIFGQLVNSFGGANQSNVVHVVSKVILSVPARFPRAVEWPSFFFCFFLGFLDFCCRRISCPMQRFASKFNMIPTEIRRGGKTQ